MFIIIIIIFKLGSDKLVWCLFYCLSQGISHGMWLLAWVRVDDFNFRLFKSILVFVNWISLYFFSSFIVLTCYVYYYCILLGFNTLFSCYFAGFLLFSPKGSVAGCDSSRDFYSQCTSFRVCIFLPTCDSAMLGVLRPRGLQKFTFE